MAETICHALDDYFDDCLSQEDRLAFEQHLALCPECSEAVWLQRRLDSELRCYAESLTLPSPVALAQTQSSRTNRKRVLAAAVVAALGLIALVLWSSGDRSEPPSTVARQPINTPESQNPGTAIENTVSKDSVIENSNARPNQIQFRSITADGYLIVVEPPSEDELTFVMLYPTITSTN